MKKVTRIAAMSLTGIVLCYLGLSGYVWYHDTQRTVYSQVPRSALEKNNQVLGLLREKGCDYCHTPSADLPFYASFPIAKQLMEYDIRLGYQSFNLEPVRASLIEDKAVSQSDLNKIEWVMQHKTMPPTRYVALHWAGQVDEQERETLLGWIAQQRARYYASNEAAAEHRNEPIQPIPKALPVDAQKVALGFRLYHDPRLSGDSTLSCAHCHSLNTGGVDGRKTSIGVGGAVGPINAPTVFNSVFNSEQFWDGRAPTLQVQAGGPPLNPIEMASKSWEEIIGKLDKDPVLTRDFVAAYPQGLSGETITDAIAEFEKTLITPDSPFDNWLRGDDKAMTMQQKHGYQLFKDNKCATCHGGTILGGRSFEPLGLKRDFNFGEITAADIGRMNVTSEARDRLRQKVPGLRNVALTAPYFHRGDVATLDEAVKLMLRYQVGTELPQQDVDDIVAFLESLTGVYTPYTQSQK
ncbi:cytochrome-c peroxidase [Serratia liquefaciens]|uniref:cytochrome-c peroxidase n=1 Tax=Serratia liquefaciens TaxID=614 RepID=UPI0003586402|nr:cytochrome-c peroxidase [Serratia liquefaciens]AGQ30675.1 cytochrome C peroxidase [Serratia liquefaciens ATCC 27592]CAI0866267.1 Cytochrome c551 peroxidase precursor [Serratia liquefaciens]CAI2128892.1 Cytochrome c551 peroxidase precursor [Serratia liquefaciens]CAI2483590.1 Cytochrome c551 peroxidase precursor [Serratia liquefaciens]HBL6730393.1 cytochrome-c peroxidase [Serratia liquefaciens]